MNKIFIILCLALGMAACSSSDTSSKVEIEEQIVQRYPQGEPKLVQLFKVENGQRDLYQEKTYYSCGALKVKGDFMNGKRNGLWESWHKNGNKWTEAEYLNGVQNGKAGHWFENGKPLYIGQYKDDKRSGTWKFYTEDGKLKKTIEY